MQKKRVGIMGGAGYTGGELVRLLMHHEGSDLVFVQSRSQAGNPVASVHVDLAGETELKFSRATDAEIESLDTLFLALSHGEARRMLSEKIIPAHVKLIDLSADFRLKSESNFQDRKFVYGLPEAFRQEIRSSTSVANPGCFATAIEGALLPLARAGLLNEAFVTGVTGSTGAGIASNASTHFSFRAENIQAYKSLSHQHVAEIEQTLHALAREVSPRVSFVPWRGGFTRGIFVSAIVESALSKDQALSLYQEFYQSHPFVVVTPEAIDLKSVINTNKMKIQIEAASGKLVVHVAIDNLLKGAAGQAVQNYNLMSGFPETTGLRLKAAVF